VTLHVHQYAAGLHTINHAASLKNTFRREITVPGRCLDSILDEAKISDVCLLKIDTEGSELDVLVGALGLLRRSSALTILIEAWTSEPLDLLVEEGFEVTHILDKDYVAVKRPSARPVRN
jgi:hypothetical protein